MIAVYLKTLRCISLFFFLLSVYNKIRITISFKLENFAILWEGSEYSHMKDPHNGCDSGDLETPSLVNGKMQMPLRICHV